MRLQSSLSVHSPAAITSLLSLLTIDQKLSEALNLSVFISTSKVNSSSLQVSVSDILVLASSTTLRLLDERGVFRLGDSGSIATARGEEHDVRARAAPMVEIFRLREFFMFIIFSSCDDRIPIRFYVLFRMQTEKKSISCE